MRFVVTHGYAHTHRTYTPQKVIPFNINLCDNETHYHSVMTGKGFERLPVLMQRNYYSVNSRSTVCRTVGMYDCFGSNLPNEGY